jgi:two-component system, NtrC family, nitrogen regulation sensor histidine kinase NtrY
VQDVGEVVAQAVDLFQLARADIDFKTVLPEEAVVGLCDRRLLTQAITNLIKNATEGVQAVKEQPGGGEAGYRGHIEVSVTTDAETVTISVVDNGCGLPKKDRNRLVEPYMTTRAKGTGIGLAVVNRVTEQHGGNLVLEDAPFTDGRTHGAAVRMVLHLARPASAETHPIEPAIKAAE